MKIAKTILVLVMTLFVFVVPGCQPPAQTISASITLSQALSNGKPTLAEFGSVTCIPCKEMKPILEDISEIYEGRLNVVIVDVYEQDNLAQSYGIMTIPTQVIFDASGKERVRHIGFWHINQIIPHLKKAGIE